LLSWLSSIIFFIAAFGVLAVLRENRTWHFLVIALPVVVLDSVVQMVVGEELSIWTFYLGPLPMLLFALAVTIALAPRIAHFRPRMTVLLTVLVMCTAGMSLWYAQFGFGPSPYFRSYYFIFTLGVFSILSGHARARSVQGDTRETSKMLVNILKYIPLFSAIGMILYSTVFSVYHGAMINLQYVPLYGIHGLMNSIFYLIAIGVFWLLAAVDPFVRGRVSELLRFDVFMKHVHSDEDSHDMEVTE
jgi:hypothetical protein